ncbi:hypothetical protein CANINC_004385 [Pichia inconspicua]|uniref:Sm domain-containing protein n=1 Tax=Pichia inconspicua TaxID=52247 RepID=A0A4T0WXN2_9ASCO|nr:hypothetical protein CANINC_004385 [[Candida] inconspicua]
MASIIQNKVEDSQSKHNNNRQARKNTYAPKRGPIIDLEPILNKEVNISIMSGRNVRGILTGYDQLMNVVIENATITTPETISSSGQEEIHELRKVVVIGRLILCFEPLDGYQILPNPASDFEFVI